MAPLKMLGCAVAIGGIAAGLQVTRVRRLARPGLCPPGPLPARGLARPGLARAPGARLDSPESAWPRPPWPPAALAPAAVAPAAPPLPCPCMGPDLHRAPSTGTFFYAIIDDLIKPKKA
jgi:hypothetical protein